MDVYAWRVDSAHKTASSAKDIRLAKLHIDTGIVRAPQDLPPDAAGGPAAPAMDELRAALRPDVLAYLRQRWQRVKGQQRRDEWRTADWSHIDRDALVPFMEIFPSEWDLAVILTKADNDQAARLADRVVADPSLRRKLRARLRSRRSAAHRHGGLESWPQCALSLWIREEVQAVLRRLTTRLAGELPSHVNVPLARFDTVASI